MTNIVSDQAEKIKESIKETSEKSKETIREIIDSNTKHIGEALDFNKKIVDSIKVKFSRQNIEDNVTDTLKSTFGKSVELAEDTLDNIINSYMSQMEMNIDFNTKLLDEVKDMNNRTPEKVLNLIKDNFEASRKLNLKNTKEILDAYNKHTNLAVNFNQKFGESISRQIDYALNFQDKGVNKFTEWASELWKQMEK